VYLYSDSEEFGGIRGIIGVEMKSISEWCPFGTCFGGESEISNSGILLNIICSTSI